ncbi:hypothetical protein [Modestobacter altitudinis]|uniref:hypothetical protein n=1 Tax=Modestobacter altitudinis TaxID=2213158 RepID=UPI0014864359|nr:hypothetical protein [Modestobacter altitudinis]
MVERVGVGRVVPRAAGAEAVAVVRGDGIALAVAAAFDDDDDGAATGGTGGTDVGDVGGTTTGGTGVVGLLLRAVGVAGAALLSCGADALEASLVPGSDPPPIAAVSATEPTEQDSASGAHSRRHPRSRADEGRERERTMGVLTADHESLPSEGNHMRCVTGVSRAEHPDEADVLLWGICGLPQPLPWSVTGHSRRGPHLGGARRS